MPASLPPSNLRLTDIAKQLGTPCRIYDAALVRSQIEQLRRFDVIRDAQKAKANSNVHLLGLILQAVPFLRALLAILALQ
ncbi:MAG: hypothetical protein ABIQ16_25680 [Polyangiaceae bacterium]